MPIDALERVLTQTRPRNWFADLCTCNKLEIDNQISLIAVADRETKNSISAKTEIAILMRSL
jgi:hypothetical protein